MPSIIYNSCLDDLAKGLIDFDNNSFKVMLVTSSYTPDKDTHLTRTAVTNEVSGAGYSAGGTATTVTVTKNVNSDQIDISFSSVNWPNATITAHAAVIYKSTGNAATDNLVAYVDFGTDVSSTGATFTVTFSSPLRFQN